MKAVQYTRYGGPEVLYLDDVPDPPCGPDDIRIAMRAASVNPVDGKLRSGLLVAMTGPITGPTGTGRDGAGVVVEAGANVDPALMDKTVAFLTPREITTWAGQVVLPASLVTPVPEGIDARTAAALPLVGLCAWRALVDVAQVHTGQRVLIHAAAGGIGHIAVQLAKHLGAEVIGTCSAANRDFVRGLGADRVVAYDKENFADVLQDIDVVYDVIGGAVHTDSARVLARDGVLVYLHAAPVDTPDLPHGARRELVTIQPEADALGRVFDLVAKGHITPVVSNVLPLSDFANAQALSDAGHVRGKIVIDI